MHTGGGGMSAPSGRADAAAVLIDLDGPITRLFPSPAHIDLARAVHARVAHDPGAPPTAGEDHVQVLRRIASATPHLLAETERFAARAEMAAARRATPAPGAVEFIRAAAEAGYGVAVVSNNAAPAVAATLTSVGVADWVAVVAARHPGNISRLKPHPDLVDEALHALGVSADHAILLGDTVSDMRAALAAGVRAIGVTADDDRASQLRTGGASMVVRDLGEAVGLLDPSPARVGERP
ncbi:MAG: HAD family hydrolase [Tetrasphaera sp.]|nr:HAD family hydrolase [Tetrasphaera sp.]